MKITHIISTFSPEHGGPTTSIGTYCQAQAERGHEVRLYTLQGFPGTTAPPRIPGLVAQQAFDVEGPAVLGYSSALARHLRTDQSPDVYHIHGLWHLARAAGAREARRRCIPYIYHLQGGFSAYELRLKPVRKILARLLYQDQAMKHASCLHANDHAEAAFVHAQGFKNPFAVLPVGVDTRPTSPVMASQAARIADAVVGKRVLLYLARIHPTKGIDPLLESWQRVQERFSDWILLVAGSGPPDYVAQVKERTAALGLADRVIFAGLVSETEKSWCYENASAYVLPSLQENFGNSVVEALAKGTPVITTTHTPWAELVTEKAGWICEPVADSLTDTLGQVLSLSDAELRAAGAAGKALAEHKYSLGTVMDRMDQLYDWLRHGSDHSQAPGWLSYV
jgi:glycosyltransferase involved in cell wall biosynthesis